MKADNVEFPGKHNSNEHDPDNTQKLPALKHRGTTGTLEKHSFDMDSSNTASDEEMAMEEVSLASLAEAGEEDDDQIEMPVNDAMPTSELTNVE